jgi:putative transcriptional regulator
MTGTTRKTPSSAAAKTKRAAPAKRAKRAVPGHSEARATAPPPRIALGRDDDTSGTTERRKDSPYLTGHFLIAMPTMGDPRFEKTVIYMCHHDSKGAMGLIVNRPMSDLKFPDILQQLKIEVSAPCNKIIVHRGGPVAPAQGFVLHTTDFVRKGSLIVNDTVALSATTDILKAVAAGFGPKRMIMALGYSGWGGGQLDSEIKQNAWLSVAADDDLLFSGANGDKWDRAMAKIGIDPRLLSGTAGHA